MTFKESSHSQELKATGQQQERKGAYMEAEKHGGVHDGHLGGKVDQGRNTVVVQAISGGHSLVFAGTSLAGGSTPCQHERQQEEQGEGPQLLLVVGRWQQEEHRDCNP